MSRFEDAVDHDLASAPDAPPVERVERRAQRRRVRRYAATASAAFVILVAIAVGIATTGSGSSVRVTTVSSLPKVTSSSVPTSSSLPASVAALPLASEHTFPGLGGILRTSYGYDLSDGPVEYGEIVATTRDKTYAYFGGRQPVDRRAIYLVRLHGKFVCNSCSVPPGAAAPRGDEILFTVTRLNTPPLNDVFEVGSRPLDLSVFGRVYRLPPLAPVTAPVTTRIDLPARTMKAGSYMTAHVVVENRSGHVLHVPGCGSLFAVALVKDGVPPDIPWPTCIGSFTVRRGRSTYTARVNASYSVCSGSPQHPPASGPTCVNGSASLPPGSYEARLFQMDEAHGLPTAPPIAVRVTP